MNVLEVIYLFGLPSNFNHKIQNVNYQHHFAYYAFCTLIAATSKNRAKSPFFGTISHFTIKKQYQE